jgi:hypothetical protein
MPDEGSNTITNKGFVNIEYDPFKETTKTSYQEDVYLTVNYYDSIKLHIQHFRDASNNSFLIHIYRTHEDYDKAHNLSIMILADQEKIEPIDTSQNTKKIKNTRPVYNDYDEYVNEVDDSTYEGYAYAEYSNDDIKKILDAENIEIRIYSDAGGVDVSSESENDIQRYLGCIYHEAVDNNLYKNYVDASQAILDQELKELDEQQKKDKMFKYIKWGATGLALLFLMNMCGFI